jgi:broad specificity phosphatase PhoE/ribosomal protein S18 acetylase RimI-like enzyme
VHVVYETHATTYDNERGFATGWLPGELSPTGVAEARELGERRRADGLDLVVSSDLARAVATVGLAFDGSPVPRATDRRLREVDYGELNGAPVAVIDAQRRARVDTPFPGGQSYGQVTDGVDTLLRELLNERQGQRVLLVGHAATRFALDHLLTARPLEAAVVAPFAWRRGWTYDVTAHRPVLATLDGPGALAVAGDLAGVYGAAFGAPGYDEAPEAAQRFRDEQLVTHARRDGFRCVTVRLADRLVGFGYGYTGDRGQWWSDQIARNAPAEIVATWLGGHFELVELAADPAFQGRGFATALHDALLLDLPHERALLTTYRDERPAPRLYRRLGWTLLHPGALPDSDLWGRDLRARSG